MFNIRFESYNVKMGHNYHDINVICMKKVIYIII